MARGDGVVRVIGELRSSDNVSPQDANPVAWLHIDDLCGYRLAVVGVASDVSVIDVLDRVVLGQNS